jgi:hypothetical protein
MQGLPAVTPWLGWQMTLRLPRDYYIRLGCNDYSVHPSAVGRRVEVSADLETVTVTCSGRVVASHRRCWARHQSITDPEHSLAAEQLRRLPRLSAPVVGEVEQRSLADYDVIFGLTEQVA